MYLAVLGPKRFERCAAEPMWGSALALRGATEVTTAASAAITRSSRLIIIGQSLPARGPRAALGSRFATGSGCTPRAPIDQLQTATRHPVSPPGNVVVGTDQNELPA